MFCLKSTSVCTKMRALQGLEKRCLGIGLHHRHDHAWGTVSVNGRSYSKASFAGRYPESLCREWSNYAVSAITDRFWDGTAPWRRR